jgi:hypothetical protein
MPPAPTQPDDTGDAQRRVSRSARLAAGLVGGDERVVAEHLFAGTVLIGIEPGYEDVPDARLILCTLCNQVLRFCPNVVISTRDESLYFECVTIAISLHGPNHGVRTLDANASSASVAKLMVGRSDLGDGTIVVNSSGWVARIATSRHGRRRLIPWNEAHPNALGAVAAACLGAGRVFFRLIG